MSELYVLLLPDGTAVVSPEPLDPVEGGRGATVERVRPGEACAGVPYAAWAEREGEAVALDELRAAVEQFGPTGIPAEIPPPLESLDCPRCGTTAEAGDVLLDVTTLGVLAGVPQVRHLFFRWADGQRVQVVHREAWEPAFRCPACGGVFIQPRAT